MQHLQAEQVAELRAALVSERERLLVELKERDDNEALGDGRGDFQDRASEEESRMGEGRMKRRVRLRLEEVEAALRRMELGSYGICEESDDEIPFARLKLEPVARYTAEAQEELEEERLQDSEVEGY